MVYLTRCADLAQKKLKGREKQVTLLGDVRFTRDQLGHWNCVVQRRPRAVRPLRPVEERKTVHIDPGVRTFSTGYSATEGKVVSYCSGDGGVDVIITRHLQMADDLISEQLNLKRNTDFSNNNAKAAYNKKVCELNHRKLRHFVKAKNLIKEMHCRAARDLTANYDTIVLPPFKTKDMSQRKRMRADGTIQYRLINSGTVRSMLMLKHYGYKLYLKHRCLCDGSEFAQPGEEYTTKACAYWCVLLRAARGRRERCGTVLPEAPLPADTRSLRAQRHVLRGWRQARVCVRPVHAAVQGGPRREGRLRICGQDPGRVACAAPSSGSVVPLIRALLRPGPDPGKAPGCRGQGTAALAETTILDVILVSRIPACSGSGVSGLRYSLSFRAASDTMVRPFPAPVR